MSLKEINAAYRKHAQTDQPPCGAQDEGQPVSEIPGEQESKQDSQKTYDCRRDHMGVCEQLRQRKHEKEKNGKSVISEIGYTIDNTSKTRAIFEINKGVPKHPEIDVNSKVPEELRRVRFENMIYIADGPSDIPAFSVVNKNGGATFAVYPKGDLDAFQQVEQMRRDGRIDMYAEADYSEGTTAYMWIENKIVQFAEKMRNAEKEKLTSSISKAPIHLED